MNDSRINALQVAVDQGIATGDFPSSLIEQFNRRGSLSEKQWYWVEKLTNPEPPKTVAIRSMEGVIALFERAAEHLKYPKIRMGFGMTWAVIDGRIISTHPTEDDAWKAQEQYGAQGNVEQVPFLHKLRLSVAGERSKYAGQIQLTDGRPYGENTYYGRISVDGEITMSRWFDTQDDSVQQDFVSTLARLADEPEVIAAEYGKYSGNCCFCNKPIGEGDDRRSAEVGYGSTCAKSYGLPWGVK